MIGLLHGVVLGGMLAQWAYHRWWSDKPEVKEPERRFRIPRVDNGAPLSLIYGRTRVRNAVLGWASTPTFDDNVGTVSYGYQMDMMFTLGIPFESGTTVVHGMYVGDERASWGLITNGFDDSTQTGNGGTGGVPETSIIMESGDLGDYKVHGAVETLNGNASQVIVDAAGVSQTQLGDELLASGLTAAAIPGYRGVVTAFLTNDSSSDQFSLGPNATIPQFHFEVSSYRAHSWLTSSTHYKIGDDANPISCLYDLCVAWLGKAGIPSTYIDETSFAYAAYQCVIEGNGFSCEMDSKRPLADQIRDIEIQVDGLIYQDPTDSKLHVKLMRADNNTPQEINRTNCIELTNFVMGSQDGLVNQYRLVYQSRARDYADADVTARNGANSAAQGFTIESVGEMRGVSNLDNAYRIALRELAARCRPIIKCRAILDRSWYALVPGDLVKLTWKDPDVAGLLFRVARVDRGTLADGAIAADLILDTSYTTRAGTIVQTYDTKETFHPESESGYR